VVSEEMFNYFKREADASVKVHIAAKVQECTAEVRNISTELCKELLARTTSQFILSSLSLSLSLTARQPPSFLSVTLNESN
jgi:hypothetical protein